MSKIQAHSPDMLPLLSRGKHRNPRKGACFMELASYLACERWSDHPPCTHWLLASVARLVNDYTSDEGRPHLAELIPAVIGLTGDDLHIDALISLRCATIALPVAAADRQRVLAVSVLVCERVLARLDGRRGTVCVRTVSGCSRQCPKRRNGPAASPVRSVPGQRPPPAVRTGRCPLRGRGRRTRADPKS